MRITRYQNIYLNNRLYRMTEMRIEIILSNTPDS